MVKLKAKHRLKLKKLGNELDDLEYRRPHTLSKNLIKEKTNYNYMTDNFIA